MGSTKDSCRALLVLPIEPSLSETPLEMVKFSLRAESLTLDLYRTLVDRLPKDFPDNLSIYRYTHHSYPLGLDTVCI